MTPGFDTSLMLTCIQSAELAVLLLLTVRLISERDRSLPAVFLSFCFALWLFTDLYWVVYDLMRSGMRMPFAANEIGEAATFLMMAATLNSVACRDTFTAKKAALPALIFAACNVALWIAWSGEWVEDIFIGLAFSWLLKSVACSLMTEQVLTEKERTVPVLLCVSLIASEALTFIPGNGIKAGAELCGYLILLAGAVFFAYVVIRTFRKGSYPGAMLSSSFALLAWTVTGKYMSDGSRYNLFMATELPCLLLLYLSVKKAVKKA